MRPIPPEALREKQGQWHVKCGTPVNLKGATFENGSALRSKGVFDESYTLWTKLVFCEVEERIPC